MRSLSATAGHLTALPTLPADATQAGHAGAAESGPQPTAQRAPAVGSAHGVAQVQRAGVDADSAGTGAAHEADGSGKSAKSEVTKKAAKSESGHRNSCPAPHKTGPKPLTTVEWEHVVRVKTALRKAMAKTRTSEAEIKRRCRVSKNTVHRWCDLEDSLTMPARYIGLLPPSLRSDYMTRLDEAYGEDTTPPPALGDNPVTIARATMQAGTRAAAADSKAVDSALAAVEDGVVDEAELARQAKAHREQEKTHEDAARTARVAAEYFEEQLQSRRGKR